LLLFIPAQTPPPALHRLSLHDALPIFREQLNHTRQVTTLERAQHLPGERIILAFSDIAADATRQAVTAEMEQRIRHGLGLARDLGGHPCASDRQRRVTCLLLVMAFESHTIRIDASAVRRPLEK